MCSASSYLQHFILLPLSNTSCVTVLTNLLSPRVPNLVIYQQLFSSLLQLSPTQVTSYCCSSHCSDFSQQPSTYSFPKQLPTSFCSLPSCHHTSAACSCALYAQPVKSVLIPCSLPFSTSSSPLFLLIQYTFPAHCFVFCHIIQLYLPRTPKYLNTLDTKLSPTTALFQASTHGCPQLKHQKLKVGGYTEEVFEWFNYSCVSAYPGCEVSCQGVLHCHFIHASSRPARWLGKLYHARKWTDPQPHCEGSAQYIRSNSYRGHKLDLS